MLNSKVEVRVPYADTLRRDESKLNLLQVALTHKRCRITYDKRYIVDDEDNKTRLYGL